MENTDQILDAPQTEKIRLQYAGFWIRTGAYFIDAIVLYAVTFVLGFLIGDLGLNPAIGGIISLLIAILYFSLMEASEHQATLGKMAVGIRVGDRNGDQISVLNAIGRYFAKMISALLLCIGFMMVGWDERNQGIHDKLADTYVFYRQ
jgi:uncharacterized RDD family membrane protein YckC